MTRTNSLNYGTRRKAKWSSKMSKSRRRDYDYEPRVKEVRKGLDKSNKHRKNVYKYTSNRDYEDDDYDDYDTQRKY